MRKNKEMAKNKEFKELEGSEATFYLFDIRRFIQFTFIESFEVVFETLKLDHFKVVYGLQPT
ncbi:MAG: hypothetical protein LW863_14020, partial [Flammeovirgaceae bacterium]|nr:hypothetical protein [Flammeovirgaceae bacterium]